jgi:hypothetical protein
LAREAALRSALPAALMVSALPPVTQPIPASYPDHIYR